MKDEREKRLGDTAETLSDLLEERKGLPKDPTTDTKLRPYTRVKEYRYL